MALRMVKSITKSHLSKPQAATKPAETLPTRMTGTRLAARACRSDGASIEVGGREWSRRCARDCCAKCSSWKRYTEEEKECGVN